MDWARLLAHITGTVDQELLLHNEYLVAETRNLKAKIKTRLQLPDLVQINAGRDRSSAGPGRME